MSIDFGSKKKSNKKEAQSKLGNLIHTIKEHLNEKPEVLDVSHPHATQPQTSVLKQVVDTIRHPKAAITTEVCSTQMKAFLNGLLNFSTEGRIAVHDLQIESYRFEKEISGLKECKNRKKRLTKILFDNIKYEKTNSPIVNKISFLETSVIKAILEKVENGEWKFEEGEKHVL